MSIMEEKKRISNVEDKRASSITTDCLECHGDIVLNLNDRLGKECCNYVYQLEDVVDLVVYKKEDD